MSVPADNLEFPLLTQAPGQDKSIRKTSKISASSLLAISKAARLPTNHYKTLSPPIDRIVGPCLRRGYGLQISGPPGTHVEQLALGLIKSAINAGNSVVVADMQNKIKADTIYGALGNDEQSARVHYCTLHKLSDVVEFLKDLPKFLSENAEVSLLVLSSLSFPFHAEANHSTRSSLFDRVRELIIKLCKQHQLIVVITSAMSTQFIHSDGSRGTFDDDTKGILCPQIDLHCKTVSSLILSRDDRNSGRAVFTPATNQETLRAEFNFSGLELQDKV